MQQPFDPVKVAGHATPGQAMELRLQELERQLEEERMLREQGAKKT